MPSSLLFATTEGSKVSQEQLVACSELFSRNYGVWGPQASEVSRFLKAGSRVKMSVAKLRSQCLHDPASTLLATCHTGDGRLVGHAFAATWNFDGGVVCWITQLVVSVDHRRQGIATMLLRSLRSKSHTAFGLASSHPAACMALAKLGGVSMQHLDLPFIRDNTAKILQATTVDYLKGAELRGTLFESQNAANNNPSVVSSVYTNFFVDHEEPLEALKNCRARQAWPLGDLLEGHEFAIVVKATGNPLFA